MGGEQNNNIQNNSIQNNGLNPIEIHQQYLNEQMKIFDFENVYRYPKANVLWVDPNVNNQKNTNYQEILSKIPQFSLTKYTNVGETISYLKSINFKKTFIIVSGSFSKEFFISLGEIINELKVAPKIIIFTSFEKFIMIMQNILSLDKYDLFDINLVYDNFRPVLNELKIKENINNNIYFNNNFNINLADNTFTFEYINDSTQLVLPLYLTDLMEIPNRNHVKEFISFLLNNHSENEGIKELINQLLLKVNIPIQIIIKYWLHTYSLNSNFYRRMNNYLMERIGDQYDTYIQVLYYRLNQKYITSVLDQDLYRGALISKDELKSIDIYLKNKKENLPGCICYNKAFFSTSLQKETALGFMNNKIDYGLTNNKERVLYIIKSGEDFYDNTPSNVDILQFSPYDEEEILFFPFSCFEVNKIEKNIDKYGEYNIIYLLYLGKYKEKISKNEKIGDSRFTNDYFQTNCADKLELAKEPYKFDFDFNTKFISPESKIGYITSTYQITNKDLDKDIQILNCCISNKKELMEICDIYFNEEKKNFSFVYTFKYPGNYKFEFKFKKLLKNACKLFAGCKSLISIDLKDFKTNNIDNMSSMFEGCSLIESLDLTNFKTKEVITMKNMFYNCKSLKNLDISTFNTNKVINMNNMFGNCSSLAFLNLTNFNTQNVVDMSDMFKGCSSLIFLNLSSFNTEKTKNFYSMFYGCSSLTYLNISNFQINRKVNIKNMIA